jgi:hypothetical protein
MGKVMSLASFFAMSAPLQRFSTEEVTHEGR